MPPRLSISTNPLMQKHLRLWHIVDAKFAKIIDNNKKKPNI